MRLIPRWWVAGLALVLAGCDLLTGMGGDGGNGNNDGAGDTPDLLPPADLLPIPRDKLELNWRLLTANFQAGMNNGFEVECGDTMYNVQSFTFTAKNGAGESKTTSGVPCPKGMKYGVAVIDLPG